MSVHLYSVFLLFRSLFMSCLMENQCVFLLYVSFPCNCFRSRFRCVSSSFSIVPCDFFRSSFQVCVQFFQSCTLCLFQIKVQVCVQFFKVGEIDTLKEQYTADVIVRARWREPSLDGQLQEVLPLVTSHMHRAC